MKLAGPVFSLTACVINVATTVYTLFCTKLPLIMPLATGLMAVIFGLMVVHDWKATWKPLLVKKP